MYSLNTNLLPQRHTQRTNDPMPEQWEQFLLRRENRGVIYDLKRGRLSKTPGRPSVTADASVEQLLAASGHQVTGLSESRRAKVLATLMDFVARQIKN